MVYRANTMPNMLYERQGPDIDMKSEGFSKKVAQDACEECYQV
jgi:hypothetical protein